ncbi:hypothetical protein G6011_11316 [Alternaria panax]|uniref:Uncharacterized protein n=1 Tax=Alternaria panax TaxID=48097 RepID=A0AAD4ID69_9PLEO|nr:hypothetical protein G6011_11316 [Alternaria panax]
MNILYQLELAEAFVKAVKSMQKIQQQRERKEKSLFAAAQEQVQGGASQKVGDTKRTTSEFPSASVGEARQLHTGLSSSMAEIDIAVDDAGSGDGHAHSDLSATPDPEETDYGTPFDYDTEPESDADAMNSNAMQNADSVLPVPLTHIEEPTAVRRDPTANGAGTSPSSGLMLHTDLSFSMFSADIEGEDTGADAEEERGIDKHELDTPTKRKRSSSPDSGRNCKPPTEDI